MKIILPGTLQQAEIEDKILVNKYIARISLCVGRMEAPVSTSRRILSVVVMSGYIQDSMVDRILALGVQAVLIKPFGVASSFEVGSGPIPDSA